MPFVAKTLDEITDDVLANWRAQYAAATPPRPLLVSRGSDAWLMARGVAYALARLQSLAEQNSREITPDTASDEGVARWSNVYGLPPRGAVGAQHTATVRGTPSATVAIPVGNSLAWTDGTLYACVTASVALDVSGAGLVEIQATTGGEATTRNVGDVLTWQSAPAGLNPTATVAGTITPGADVESIGSLAARITAALRDRPAGGNAADWRAWALAFVGYDIRDVWVYRRLRPPTYYPGPGDECIDGCVTLVCAGPAQGDRVENTRILGGDGPGAELPLVKAYIEGRVAPSGLVVTDGPQLRPATMRAEDYGAEAITVQEVDVTLTLVTTTAAGFSWSPFFTLTVDPSSTATALVVVGDATSGATNVTGKGALVNVGPTHYRGGYYRVVLPLGVYDGVNTTFDLTATPLPFAPSGLVYSAPGCWASVRLALFDLFDALGPGDTISPSRWPSQDVGARSTLYRDVVRGLASRIPGVLSANVIAPAADVTPPAKTVLTLGTLTVYGS